MEKSIINTFDKGLHQDSTFILQPDGTYRNMKNGTLISNDGNHYTVEFATGNRVILRLTPRLTVDEITYDTEPIPIGFASFIDKLVVFSTNSESTTGYGEIGVVSFTRNGNDFVGSYVTYYHHASLNFTKLHKIEAWTFRENDNISRVYWTDNFNEPRVFDIANPIFTTYFVGAADLTVGKTYMVLNGAISYGGINYGPTNGSGSIVGNIFTATALGGTSFTSLSSPLIRVIEYYPISLLDWIPTRLLGEMKFEKYGNGSKYCGTNVYFYRLSSTFSGIETSWSYASTPIHVGTENISVFLSGNKYNDFVGAGSSTSLVNSNYSVILEVSGIDTNFDVIELCCAEFTQDDDVPYRIIIVNKLNITSDKMFIEDLGSVNLGTVTISDLTIFPASILKCKTIASNKGYATVGNITEREEFDLDLTTVNVSQFEYPMVCHGDLTLCVNGNIPKDVSPPLLTNPMFTDVTPYTRWLVTFGNLTTDTVLYEGVYYVTGEVIVGGSIYSTIYFTNNGAVRPCTTKNRYTVSNTSSPNYNKRVENAIELTTGFWNYKDPAVASHNKGYFDDEKYRLAFIAFDLKGNPYYAKYIKDFTFSRSPNKSGGGLIRKDAIFGTTPTQYSYALNPSAIKISNLNIPESVMNKMSGFSIVRAERDPTILAQGLLMQTVLDPDPSQQRLMPLGVTRTDCSLYAPYYNPSGDLCSCICPDWLVGQTLKESISKPGAEIKEAFWLDGGMLKTFSSPSSYVTKMFDTKPDDSDSPRVRPLGSMNGSTIYGYDEYNGMPNPLGIAGIDFYNRFSEVITGEIIGQSDYTCTSIPNYSFSFLTSVGCKKLQIFPKQFTHYGPTANYNWLSGAPLTNYNKIVVNFMSGTNPSDQYGGISEAAIANTNYMPTGHFQPINSQVKADTLNGTFSSGTYAGENKYTFNDIEIFGGDCFTNLIDIAYSIWDEVEAGANNLAYSIWFPCQNISNYDLRRGRKVSNSGLYPEGDVESIKWETPTRLEYYSYNKGYSAETDFIKYPSLPYRYKFTGKYDYRIRWSKVKYPGELIDSFRVFRLPDYRDLDGQRGQINNLKTRDSKLFYWQDHSVGYTPILERQLVGGSALGDATSLGVTGVIDRYDDIDTYFGNQHQHGLTETEYGFAWFDMRRRAFMVMGIGTKPEEMSMIKGMQVFFNNEFNEGDIFFPNTLSKIYNTNDLNINEIPLMGYGIVGVYDPRFKMTYLTFKYKYEDSEVTMDDVNYEVNINKDFTLGYNHILNAFVSFYDFTPAIWHNHNDLVLSANDPKNTKSYNANMLSVDYVIGDTVKVGNVEYICIEDVTITSYPGTLTPMTGTSPLAPNSQSWLAINETNEIYLQTFGAELCKFYGKVWDMEHEVVVNAKTDIAVTPQNIQVKSVGGNADSVYFDTTHQSSSDINISSTSRDYRWIDESWFSSVPLPSNGRLTDYYVKIKFVFKNYVTDPTVAKNIQRVTQWLRTFFINKR